MASKEVVAKKEVKGAKKEVAPKIETKVVETKPVNKEKKEKKARVVVQQMTNGEMKELFHKNGCMTRTDASDTSKVVYNTFGTQSRVLQQCGGYQLLLTNGHKKVKEQVVECENDDTLRFLEFVGKLSDEDKKFVVGADTVMSTKLSDSEMPRERSAKITDYNVLVKFIQFMGSFDENKLVKEVPATK